MRNTNDDHYDSIRDLLNGLSFEVAANHVGKTGKGPDYYGWNYVKYEVYESKSATTNYSGAVSSGTSDKAKVNPTFKNKYLTVVFKYKPVMMEIKHLWNGVLIDTNKNTSGPIPFYKISTSAANPNHQCGSLSCRIEGGECVTLHKVTSLNKIIWPGYILLSGGINGSQKGLETTMETPTAVIDVEMKNVPRKAWI